jgi:hypothetical protein
VLLLAFIGVIGLGVIQLIAAGGDRTDTDADADAEPVAVGDA